MIIHPRELFVGFTWDAFVLALAAVACFLLIAALVVIGILGLCAGIL